jgi:hypothetical protein
MEPLGFLRSSEVRTFFLSVIAACVLLIGSATPLLAATVTLAWDPNPEPNIAGYIVSYGTTSRNYSTSVDVGKVTTWSVSLVPGSRYYFAAQAYNTSGVRSAFSTEVSTSIVANGPSIISLSPTSGSVGTSVVITGANFGATQGTSVVRFNGTVGTPTSWSAGTIAVPVPTGAATGPVVVTVNGAASNGVTFTVPATISLPAPWISGDIGTPAVGGRASYSPNVFSVAGAGADIWGSTDQFQYVYQPLDGNGAIVAAVAALQLQDPWTKAGVMIREDLTGNAPNAMVAVTPSNGTIFQWRGTRGGPSTSTAVAGGAPRWLGLARNGNLLSAYYSTNGTTWTLIGTQTVPMATRVYVGMAVTSHKASATATGIFAYPTVIKSQP